MQLKLLFLFLITSGISFANQIMLDQQKDVPMKEDRSIVRSEDPYGDVVELLDFELVDPNEQIDIASLNPPLWVFYLNKLTTPLFVLYNKIYKWFRIHHSVRGQKIV